MLGLGGQNGRSPKRAAPDGRPLKGTSLMNVSAAAAHTPPVRSAAPPPPPPPSQTVDSDGDHDNGAPDVKQSGGGTGSLLNIKA